MFIVVSVKECLYEREGNICKIVAFFETLKYFVVTGNCTCNWKYSNEFLRKIVVIFY